MEYSLEFAARERGKFACKSYFLESVSLEQSTVSDNKFLLILNYYELYVCISQI